MLALLGPVMYRAFLFISLQVPSVDGTTLHALYNQERVGLDCRMFSAELKLLWSLSDDDHYSDSITLYLFTENV